MSVVATIFYFSSLFLDFNQIFSFPSKNKDTRNLQQIKNDLEIQMLKSKELIKKSEEQNERTRELLRRSREID